MEFLITLEELHSNTAEQELIEPNRFIKSFDNVTESNVIKTGGKDI